MSDAGSPSMAAPASGYEPTAKDGRLMYAMLTSGLDKGTTFNWEGVSSATDYSTAASARSQWTKLKVKVAASGVASGVASGDGAPSSSKTRAKKASTNLTPSKVKKAVTPRKKKVTEALEAAAEKVLEAVSPDAEVDYEMQDEDAEEELDA